MRSTAARAERATPGPVGQERVPAEFVGRARQFMRRIAEAEINRAEILEKWIGPLRPRPFFTPMPRHKSLKLIADNWCKIPNYGSLGLTSTFDKRAGLHVVEIRCSATRIRLPEWSDGDDEPGLILAMSTLTVRPPAFTESILPIASLGLHSLSRRYQRGATRDDMSVLADLAPVAHYYRTMCDKLVEKAAAASTQRDVDRLGDFEIVAGDGKWLGSLLLADGQPVLAIRTFIGG